jgi:hypothetical protein
VQVSIVAQDKKGAAIGGLHSEDLEIFDNGVRREIRLFVEDKPASGPPGVALPAGAFTNQIAGNAATGYSVLLFDNLNIDSGADVATYTARVREKALRALQTIPPGDRIAIYALGCQFQVFREFTSARIL